MCEQAGRESLAALAFDHAALQLGRALQLTAADDHSVAAAELALSWAQARWHADHAESEIQAAFLQAIERARLAGSPALLAEAATGIWGGDEPVMQISMASLRPMVRELVGTEGFLRGMGTFDTYEKCVAANCADAPLDFDFAGGKLGLQRNAGTLFAESDDSDDSANGGRGATFRLSRLDACP